MHIQLRADHAITTDCTRVFYHLAFQDPAFVGPGLLYGLYGRPCLLDTLGLSKSWSVLRPILYTTIRLTSASARPRITITPMDQIAM